MRNIIRLNIISNTLYFNYVDKKNSLYTWKFTLTNPPESERILFCGLFNHYRKYENVDLIINSNDLKLLTRNRWL